MSERVSERERERVSERVSERERTVLPLAFAVINNYEGFSFVSLIAVKQS